MKTIELDFDKKQELKELHTAIRKYKIKVGTDPLIIKLFISHNISDTTYAAYLLLMVEYFTSETFSKPGKAGGDLQKRVSRFSNLYFHNYDVHKLEKSIRKAFKLNIELEKKNPIDAVFGIWKNENITNEHLRNKKPPARNRYME